MKIREAIDILNTQVKLERTPKGRVISEFGKENLQAAIEDVNNHDYEVTKCKNCGIVISALLVQDGCPNCGGLDFDSNVV